MFDNDRCSKEREGYRECREFPEQGNIGGEPDKTGEQVKDFSGQSVDENPAVFGDTLVRVVQWRIFIGIQMPVGLVGEPAFQRSLRQGGSPPDLDELTDVGGDQVLDALARVMMANTPICQSAACASYFSSALKKSLFHVIIFRASWISTRLRPVR